MTYIICSFFFSFLLIAVSAFNSCTYIYDACFCFFLNQAGIDRQSVPLHFIWISYFHNDYTMHKLAATKKLSYIHSQIHPL